MNENDNNFESLRQLLALKRHEVPPPGYFDRFPDSVISRIQAGEAAQQMSFAERLASEAPWLFKILSAFESKPAFAGSFASALCLLLLFGIVYSERPEATPQQTALFTTASASGTGAAGEPALAASAAVTLPDATSPITEPAHGLAVSTNYSLQPVASMFGQQNPLFQPAGLQGNQ